MSKNQLAIWSLIEDLSDDEVVTLGDLVAGLNRVEMVDGAPRYSSDEMDLIGRFQDVDDEEESDDEEEIDEAGDNAVAEEQVLESERQFQSDSSAPQL